MSGVRSLKAGKSKGGAYSFFCLKFEVIVSPSLSQFPASGLRRLYTCRVRHSHGVFVVPRIFRYPSTPEC